MKRTRGYIAAWLVVGGGLVSMALGADLLAGELPLWVKFRGQSYLLPGMGDTPEALQGMTHVTLAAAMGPDDRWIPTPVPWGPHQQDVGFAPWQPPSSRHLLGTDQARRDVLARMLHGFRSALVVGLGAAVVYVPVGVMLGLFAAWAGGWVDRGVTVAVQWVLSLPLFFVLLAAMGLWEGSGYGAVIGVIASVYWTRIARLVRADASVVLRADYVLAARSVGVGERAVVIRHVLPQLWGPVGVAAALGVGSASVLEAGLSLVGFGLGDGVPTWGSLLRGAQAHPGAWWLALFPGLGIVGLVAVGHGVASSLTRSPAVTKKTQV